MKNRLRYAIGFYVGGTMDEETIMQQLRRVRIAISRIEGGAQEYTIGNRRLTRADLKTLYDRENALQNALTDIRGGGLCVTFAEKGTD